MNIISGQEIPEGWQKGQLLDLKRYSNGTFDAFLLGVDEKVARKSGQYITFADSAEAQSFTSAWYARGTS